MKGVHPIPDIWTTFVPAKMVHISKKSIKAKDLLGKTFSKVHISGIGCITITALSSIELFRFATGEK